MNPFLTLLFIVPAAFLLGSIPTGFLVAKSKGVDIRKHGSGNIGATNVFRTLGKPLGIFVFFADALKGFVAVIYAMHYGTGDIAIWLGIVAAVFVIAGHNYTPWLGFRGGKGIATSAGVLFALMPLAVLSVMLVWVVVFYTSRYVSLASILAAAALPVVVAVFWRMGWGGNVPLLGFALLVAILAIWRHRGNITRLRNGTESRFVKKTKL